MASTIFQNSGSVTTILGLLNQFNSFAQLSYKDDTRTTLNAKYAVDTKDRKPDTLPLLRYYGIGIRGYKNMDQDQGAMPFQPKATDMDLYSPIPFRAVPVDNDLSGEERKKYRLRVEETYSGITYACYYLKLIVWDPNQVELKQKDTDDRETTYLLDPTFLYPEPTIPDTSGSIDTNKNRVIVRVTGICEVRGDEVTEYMNVRYHGDVSKARVSELGFYTGCEATIAGQQEAIYVQLAKKRCTLGVDLSDPGASMSPYITFESSNVIDVINVI